MNTTTILIILAATIIVAGMFAFIPVEQATTVHDLVIQAIGGSSVTVSDTVASESALNAEFEYHQFVLTSDETFTIHDIEVIGIVSSDASTNDYVSVSLFWLPRNHH